MSQLDMYASFEFDRAHFQKGIHKVGEAFFSRICHGVVFTQFGYADSKSPHAKLYFKYLCFGSTAFIL